MSIQLILKIIRPIEFGLKIVEEVFIYPFFLMCLSFYVKKYTNAQGVLTTRKKMLIVWIYFIVFLSLFDSIISIVYRIFSNTDSEEWELFAIMDLVSENLVLPIGDYFRSITLIYLVYRQCLAQISKQKSESVETNRERIFSSKYDPTRQIMPGTATTVLLTGINSHSS